MEAAESARPRHPLPTPLLLPLRLARNEDRLAVREQPPRERAREEGPVPGAEAARRRGGPILAWLTVALVAVAPFALRYATETRMYALVMLLVFAGYILLDDIVRRGRVGWLRVIGLTLVTAALLYTHYWALWLVATVGAVLVWRAVRAGDDDVRRGARWALGATAAGCPSSTPVRPSWGPAASWGPCSRSET